MRSLPASARLRALSVEGLVRPSVAPPAAAIDAARTGMGWVKLASLVVDETYQRPIMRKGRQTIIAIAANFEWRKFAPLIIAPLGDGTFAIVDGQHRATAALLIGLGEAPAMIVNADRKTQAALFNAINAVVTPVHKLAAFNAAVAAGEEPAASVARVCADAGVIVCRYPVPANTMDAGMTLAAGVLERCFEMHGPEVLSQALTLITKSVTNNWPGALSGLVIRGLCLTLAAHNFACTRKALQAAFDDVDLDTIVDRCRSGRGGGSGADRFAEILSVELARRLIDAGGGESKRRRA